MNTVYLKFFVLLQLQDISEAEMYKPKSTAENVESNKKEESPGFVVTGAYWEQSAPDTASTQEFPSIRSNTEQQQGQTSAWVQAPASVPAWGLNR